MEAQITECINPLLPPLSLDVSCLLLSAWHFAGCGPVCHALEVSNLTHMVSYEHFHLQSDTKLEDFKMSRSKQEPNTLTRDIAQKSMLKCWYDCTEQSIVCVISNSQTGDSVSLNCRKTFVISLKSKKVQLILKTIY